MKKCSFKGIETYIELITLDEKGRENHNIFINAGTQMSYTVTYRDTTSVLFKSKLCSNTHLSGTVIKVNLQITIALIVPVTYITVIFLEKLMTSFYQEEYFRNNLHTYQ